MAYPEIKREEIEKLKKYKNKEVTLTEWTAAYIDPLFAPRQEGASVRDDWEQYGGYPGRVEQSTSFINIILIALVGRIEEGKIVPEYIVGKDKEGLKIFPHRTWAVSWITGVFSIGQGQHLGELLWCPKRGSFKGLVEKQESIEKISSLETFLLEKKLVQILPEV